MSCQDMLDEFEDAQSLPAMSRARLGTIDNGCDGFDEYILVKSNEDDITPEQAKEWLLPQFYHECTRPGGYFCTSMSTYSLQDRPSEVIAIVHHRYDV